METVIDPAVVKRFEAVSALPPLLSEDERLSQSIKDVRSGGCILVGTTPYRVLERYWYTEDNFIWYELQLYDLKSGEITYLEWEEDDELEVMIERERLVNLGDANLTPGKLTEMDDEEVGTVTYRGETFSYDDSGIATFYRREGDAGEKVQYWDLLSPSGTMMGVEKWDDGYSISISSSVDPLSIQVLLVGGTNAN